MPIIQITYTYCYKHRGFHQLLGELNQKPLLSENKCSGTNKASNESLTFSVFNFMNINVKPCYYVDISSGGRIGINYEGHAISL